MATLAGFRTELTAFTEAFDAAGLLASEAEAVVRDATAIVNLASTVRMLAAKRVADSAAWKHRGHRSAADWLAKETKSSFGEAKGALEAAEKIAECPQVEAKARAGGLPASRPRCWPRRWRPTRRPRTACWGSRSRRVGEVEGECRKVELSSTSDAQARHDTIHRERSVRHWTDDEGAFRLAAKLTPEAGATVLGALAPFEKAAFDRARHEKRHEPHEAYLADALVDLAAASLAGRDDGDGAAEKPKSRKPCFTVLVDLQALLRGQAEPGETCEIPGVGPIPVARLYELAPDAFWHVLVTRGRDIRQLLRHVALHPDHVEGGARRPRPRMRGGRLQPHRRPRDRPHRPGRSNADRPPTPTSNANASTTTARTNTDEA